VQLKGSPVNLQKEIRAAFVAKEIKRLLDRQAQARAFKTERKPRAAKPPKK
jgi:hypothetical protein